MLKDIIKIKKKYILENKIKKKKKMLRKKHFFPLILSCQEVFSEYPLFFSFFFYNLLFLYIF